MIGPILALAAALAATPSPPTDDVLVVGTKAMPPFVVRAPDGRWTGTSIELWRELAEEQGLRYELQERDLDGLFHGLEDGSLDLVVAAITVTADRERRVDFTHPFYTTGLAIALAHGRQDDWYDTFLAVFNAAFLRLMLIFAALQLVVGAFMWLIERRHNPHFEGPPSTGIFAGMWWAVVTMATVGYGDKVPTTGAGRLLAMTWMLASLVLLTTVTASITTSLTIGRLEAKVSGPEDLGKLRVGTVHATTSEAFLRETRLNFRSYVDARAGLDAIEAAEIDALVYDEPTLSALVADGHAKTIDILPHTFQRQDYAFALPPGSPLREPLNRGLARRVAALQDP